MLGVYTCFFLIVCYNMGMAKARDLSEKLINELAVEFESGLPVRHSLRMCGVSKTSFYRWMEKGEKDYEAGEDTIESTLWDTLTHAHAVCVKRRMLIVERDDKGFSGCKFLLSVGEEEFREKQEITTTEPIQIICDVPKHNG